MLWIGWFNGVPFKLNHTNRAKLCCINFMGDITGGSRWLQNSPIYFGSSVIISSLTECSRIPESYWLSAATVCFGFLMVFRHLQFFQPKKWGEAAHPLFSNFKCLFAKKRRHKAPGTVTCIYPYIVFWSSSLASHKIFQWFCTNSKLRMR